MNSVVQNTAHAGSRGLQPTMLHPRQDLAQVLDETLGRSKTRGLEYLQQSSYGLAGQTRTAESGCRDFREALFATQGSFSLGQAIAALRDAGFDIDEVVHAVPPSTRQIEVRYRDLLQKHFGAELSEGEKAELERLREQLEEADNEDPQLQAFGAKVTRNYEELHRELRRLNSVLDRLL